MARVGGSTSVAGRTVMQSRAAALTSAAWVLGIAVTGLVVGTPYLLFGYRNPALHLVLGSVDACIAFLLAFLLYGRLRRTQRLQDLLLTEGFLLLGLTGVALTLAVAHLPHLPPRTVEVWLPLLLKAVAAVLVVAGAWAEDRRLRRPPGPWPLVAPWALVGVASLVMWRFHHDLPAAVAAGPPTPTVGPVIDGHPLVPAVQSLGALCFLVASVLFARQASHQRDELLLWLGPACALGGFARVSYVLFPSLYTDWLYTGDVLRTLSYLVLLGGALREISQYWSAQARAAVLEDRRRLARELHDGVVQELVYIRGEAHALPDGVRREHILSASERGLDEARAAVHVLGRRPDQPLCEVLLLAARQAAEQTGSHVVVELDDSVDADQVQQHALVRITREAVSNAVRHGHARHVHVRLARQSQQRRLEVIDDGAGFDERAVSPATGYGLTSMRDRAAALPGRFAIRSAPGEGTRVEVTW